MDTSSIWALLGIALVFGFIGFMGGAVFVFLVGAAWVFSKEGVAGLAYFGVMAAGLAALVCFGLYEAFSGDADIVKQFCWVGGSIGFVAPGLHVLLTQKKK